MTEPVMLRPVLVHGNVVQVGDVLVVNQGSIGMPAYTDDNPVPHAIETGAPLRRGHARAGQITVGRAARRRL